MTIKIGDVAGASTRVVMARAISIQLPHPLGAVGAKRLAALMN